MHGIVKGRNILKGNQFLWQALLVSCPAATIKHPDKQTVGYVCPLCKLWKLQSKAVFHKTEEQVASLDPGGKGSWGDTEWTSVCTLAGDTKITP